MHIIPELSVLNETVRTLNRRFEKVWQRLEVLEEKMMGDQDGGGGEEVLGKFKTGDAFLFSDHENERKEIGMEIAKVELHQLLL